MVIRRNPYGARDEDGQAMLELALALPVLLIILTAILELGLTFVSYIEVTQAARAGARKAAIESTQTGGSSAATAAAKSSTSLVDDSKLSVTTTSPSWGEDGEVKVRVTYPYSIDILGVVVRSGSMASDSTARIQ
jgi:Flp pilus assembly protein TadG